MLVFFVGTGTGVQTFVSQALGAGERSACERWAWQGLYVLVPASVLWTGILAFAFEPLLCALGASADMCGLAATYGHARLFGVPAVVASVALASVLSRLG